MRLIWEQAGLGRGEVGFVRHPQPFLPETLERCLAEPLDWLLLPQCQWDGELCDFARVMLDDHQRAHPEAAGWRLLDPPRDHPAILAWLEQRLLRLWQEKRARQAARVPSAKHQSSPTRAEVWSGEDLGAGGRSADPAAGRMCRAGPGIRCARRDPRAGPPAGRALPGEGDLARLRAGDLHGTAGAGPPARRAARPGGPAGGTYEQPECGRRGHRLGNRRRAAPHLGPAAGRRIPAADRVGGGDRPARGPVPERDRGVVGRRRAPAEDVRAALGDVVLQNPELAGFVPSVLMELRGVPLISFARFKGPTRLGISNLFGLIPHPLRTAWHGPDITHFASVCCDLARIYGALFPLFGLVEAFDSAVRWDRKGLYRSRWGNYDLVLTDGLFTLSEGLVGADLLASRLQGQDVLRSGFYDVVRDRLGWSPAEAEMALPGDLQASLV